MKQHILISSIVRNRGDKLPNYFDQILNFVKNLSDEYDFSISIYENDSVDNSKEILKSQDYSLFVESFVKSENIGTAYYDSVPDAQRVINFANARNKTIEDLDLKKYSNILIIEPDIIYSFDSIKEIITKSSAPENTDIYSGVVMMNNVPYDIWAMRRDSTEEWGGFFSDFAWNPIKEFWSTANGACLYNIQPFLNGLKFSSFNKRLEKHDCDTVVLCEDFREMGYSNIFINQSVRLYHER